VTPSRRVKGISLKSKKKGRSQENQLQNISKSKDGKNNIKNKPIHTERASLPSPSKMAKKRVRKSWD
jgi:hypothetical protein